MRAQLEKKVAQKEKERKEKKLVDLAMRAREERAGIRAAAEKNADERERDELRRERHKERERDRRIARAAPDKRLLSPHSSKILMTVM